MPLCQLLLLSRSAKICTGMLLFFVHVGLFKVALVPALVGAKGMMCAVIPPPGACVSLSFAHLKAGTRPGWLLSTPFVSIAPGAGPPPPRDTALICAF